MIRPSGWERRGQLSVIRLHSTALTSDGNAATLT